MKYNLANKFDRVKLKARLAKLLEDKRFIEVKRILPNRSNQQNKYLHVLLGYFAAEYGEQSEYIKNIFFKQMCNEEIFKTEYTNEKTGEVRIAWRSTSDLDSGELTIAIDRFRDYASKEAGIYLPEPNEEEYLKTCEIEAERYKQYT